MNHILIFFLILSCRNIQFTENYKAVGPFSKAVLKMKELELLSESETIRHIKSLSDRDLKEFIDLMNYSLINRKYFRAADLLIKKGLDINSISASSILLKDKEILSFMITSGFDIKGSLLHTSRTYSSTSDRIRASKGDLDANLDHNNKKFMEDFNFFIGRGCDVTDTDKEGNNCFLNILKVDVFSGYKVHQKKERAIVEKKHLELLDFLVNRGFDINSKNVDTNKSVFQTACIGSTASIKFLLSKDEYNEDVLPFVLSNEFKKVVEYKGCDAGLIVFQSMNNKYKKMNLGRCTEQDLQLAFRNMKLSYDTDNGYLARAHKEMKKTIFLYIVSVYKYGYINDENKILMQSLASIKDILYEVSKHI